MSMINLALLFLFLSLHSCNARLINPHAKELLHFSISKEGEEKVHGGVGRRSLGDKSEGKGERVNHQVVKDSKNLKKMIFRVPKKKRGGDEEAPGFNLDYLPPKTHPPSHN